MFHTFLPSEDMQKGTWQVGAVSEPDYFTCYKDVKGHKKWVIQPMDAVTGKREIVQSCLYKAMTKAYFTKGEWTEPRPLAGRINTILAQTSMEEKPSSGSRPSVNGWLASISSRMSQKMTLWIPSRANVFRYCTMLPLV